MSQDIEGQPPGLLFQEGILSSRQMRSNSLCWSQVSLLTKCFVEVIIIAFCQFCQFSNFLTLFFCRIFCHQKTQRRRSRLPQVILNRKTQPHHPHQDWTNNADNSSRVRKRSSLQLVQETIRPQGFKIPNFQRSHSFCR